MSDNLELTPEFGGTCAFAAVVKKGKDGLPVGDPNVSEMVDGRLYLFSNRVARTLWRFFASPNGKFKRWFLLALVLAVLIWAGSNLAA